MASSTRLRPVLSNVSISLGMVNLAVDLIPAQKSKATKTSETQTLSSVCPTCTTAEPVRQLLFCSALPHLHGPFKAADVHKATMVGDKLTKVDPTKLAAAKVAEPTDARKGSVLLSVFPADQVEAATMPSGNIYRLRLPAKAPKASFETYALFRHLTADRERAFLGEVVSRNVAKLYRLVNRGDGVVTLAELVRPEEFHAAEPVDGEVPERVMEMAERFIAMMVEDFDPEQWRDGAKDRLAQLQAKLVEVPEATVTELSSQTAAGDLLDLLRRSLGTAAA